MSVIVTTAPAAATICSSSSFCWLVGRVSTVCSTTMLGTVEAAQQRQDVPAVRAGVDAVLVLDDGDVEVVEGRRRIAPAGDAAGRPGVHDARAGAVVVGTGRDTHDPVWRAAGGEMTGQGGVEGGQSALSGWMRAEETVGGGHVMPSGFRPRPRRRKRPHAVKAPHRPACVAGGTGSQSGPRRASRIEPPPGPAGLPAVPTLSAPALSQRCLDRHGGSRRPSDRR